jgi:cysteinyl-tRNA synthetase
MTRKKYGNQTMVGRDVLCMDMDNSLARSLLALLAARQMTPKLTKVGCTYSARARAAVPSLFGSNQHNSFSLRVAVLAQRERARALKDWAAADKLRDSLTHRGVDIYDPQGIWKASDGRVGVIVGAARGGALAGGVAFGLADAAVIAMIEQREMARKLKDWDVADKIR